MEYSPLIRNEGFQKNHGGSNYQTGGFTIPWIKIDPRVNISWGFKITYDTTGLPRSVTLATLGWWELDAVSAKRNC